MTLQELPIKSIKRTTITSIQDQTTIQTKVKTKQDMNIDNTFLLPGENASTKYMYLVKGAK